MPLYDRCCEKCGYRKDDCYEQSTAPVVSCPMRPGGDYCYGEMKRIDMTQNPGAKGRAQGDECDITVTHGLCNSDGTPHRYRSKSEMKRETEKRGLTNLVEHKGLKGSDKSPHTQRWY